MYFRKGCQVNLPREAIDISDNLSSFATLIDQIQSNLP